MYSEIPTDAIVALDGLYYKIGRFDKPFYWQSGEWLASEKSKDEVLIRKMKKKDPLNINSD